MYLPRTCSVKVQKEDSNLGNTTSYLRCLKNLACKKRESYLRLKSSSITTIWTDCLEFQTTSPVCLDYISLEIYL